MSRTDLPVEGSLAAECLGGCDAPFATCGVLPGLVRPVRCRPEALPESVPVVPPLLRLGFVAESDPVAPVRLRLGFVAESEPVVPDLLRLELVLEIDPVEDAATLPALLRRWRGADLLRSLSLAFEDAAGDFRAGPASAGLVDVGMTVLSVLVCIEPRLQEKRRRHHVYLATHASLAESLSPKDTLSLH